MEDSQQINQVPSPRRVAPQTQLPSSARGMMAQLNLFNDLINDHQGNNRSQSTSTVTADMTTIQNQSNTTSGSTIGRVNSDNDDDDVGTNNIGNNNQNNMEQNNDDAILGNNARSLLSALRSSQSFAPLIVLVLLKLLHEYAVPLFFFSMFILLRMKLDRHLVDQVYTLCHSVIHSFLFISLVVLSK